MFVTFIIILPFCQIIEILLYYQLYRDTRAYILDPFIQEFLYAGWFQTYMSQYHNLVILFILNILVDYVRKFFICIIFPFRALDALLGQMTSNMDEVTNLRRGLEDRLSKHVDVREALLKKKDEQLQGYYLHCSMKYF